MADRNSESISEAEDWLARLDRNAHVGSRHHIVPRFYLQRFADTTGRVAVLRRNSKKITICNIDNIAIKDFYTFIANDGKADGRMEATLGRVEDMAASAIRHLTSPFFRARMTPGIKEAVATFVAFQMVRGQRHRRGIELMADVYAKTVASGEQLKEAGIHRRNLRDLTATPHPNEHIGMLGKLAFPIMERLIVRPATVIEIDSPTIITCDEPVLLEATEEPDDGHLSSCHPRKRRVKKRSPRAARLGGNSQTENVSYETVHFKSTYTTGIDTASEIIIPLDPRRVLVFGSVGQVEEPYIPLGGSEAKEVADECRRLVLESTYLEVYGHPQRGQLQEVTLPPLKPLLEICGLSDVERGVATRLPDPVRSQILRDRKDG